MKKLLLLLIIPFLIIGQDTNYDPDIDVHYTRYLVAPFDYKGDYSCSYSWLDKLGRNVLIISGEQVWNRGNGTWDEFGLNMEIQSGTFSKFYASHHILSSPNNDKIWEIRDFFEPEDLAGGMFFGISDRRVQFSDLNNNNIYESWLLYSLSTEADDRNFKIIMHEGENKYAVRGHCYDYDMYGKDSFFELSSSFYQYATKMVKNFCNDEMLYYNEDYNFEDIKQPKLHRQ